MLETVSLSPREYAILIFQMLQDFSADYIKIDIALILVKMLTRHPIDNAVFFSTGEPYNFGAIEFPTEAEARDFWDQLSPEIRYAALLNSHFEVRQYPYYSRVMEEWVFLETQATAVPSE